jgi:hypothetical protein
VPCLPSELPGHHHRAQAQRGCCASELVGLPSRMDRHPVACLGCHGQSVPVRPAASNSSTTFCSARFDDARATPG